MGGYTFWSEPVTENPFSRMAAAAEAIAVPQMPTKWTELIVLNIFLWPVQIILAGLAYWRDRVSNS